MSTASPSRSLAQADLKNLAELRRRRDQFFAPNPTGDERAHSRGLLTANERIELLLDPGSQWAFGYGLGPTPLQLGFGEIHGRPVLYKAHDTSGGVGAYNLRSRVNMRAVGHIVDKAALPMFYLFQGAGGQIEDHVMSSGFSAVGGQNVGARSSVPRRGGVFTAILGNSFAPWAASVADFSVMTPRATATFVSPFIIEFATGKRPDLYEMGGVDVHTKLTGQICRRAEDEAEAMETLRTCFSYLPGHAFESAPRIMTGDPRDRCDDELQSLVPKYPNRPYEVRKIIERVVDRDSFFEWQPEFGMNMVTGFARLDGRTVAIMANQPKVRGGAIDMNALFKARRIVKTARTFSLPLLSFCDTPGIMTTQEEEHKGLLTETTVYISEKMESEVPTVCVTLGKGIGMGYFIMGGSDPEAITLSWPTTQIAYLGPEGGAAVVHRKKLAAVEEPDDHRLMLDELAEPFRRNMNPWRGAQMATIDNIIDPAETRPRVIQAFEALGRGGRK